jgi:DNA (cytosine-5)-methyltransferase 1
MLKVLSLFSGIGAFEKALSNLKIPFELVAFAEIDEFASHAYGLIHNVHSSKNLGDVKKIDTSKIPDFNLMTWGFPCIDVSIAGKGKGFIDEHGKVTRSGMYFEGMRILQAKRPKYSIIENVKNLVGKKFEDEFESILQDLTDLGYVNYGRILNAKDFGIPQNRERMFIISALGEHKSFIFPKPFDNGLRLKDLLEDKVEEKYYISDEKTSKLLHQLKIDLPTGYVGNVNPSEKGMNGCVYNEQGLSPTLTTNKGEGPKILLEPNVLRYERNDHGKQVRKEYELGQVDERIGNMRNPVPRTDGIANTLSTVLKDNMLAIPVITPDRIEKRQFGRRFKEDGDPMFTLTGQDRHGVLCIGEESNELKFMGGIKTGEMWIDDGKNLSRNYRTGNRIYDPNGIAVAQTAEGGGLAGCTGLYVVPYYRIRKLTPTECWRLMGFPDEDINKCIRAGISNSQLYKMAGNSIVVNVLEKILGSLFLEIEEDED